MTDAASAVTVALELSRTRKWSIGIGIGEVEEPLPAEVRSARGPAFVLARDAVRRAKRAPGRVAVSGDAGAEDAEALLRLLVDLRDRRSPQGWEVYDLLAQDIPQRDIATRLGVSPAAVSMRATTARIRLEEAAVPAVVRTFARADAPA